MSDFIQPEPAADNLSLDIRLHMALAELEHQHGNMIKKRVHLIAAGMCHAVRLAITADTGHAVQSLKQEKR